MRAQSSSAKSMAENIKQGRDHRAEEQLIMAKIRSLQRREVTVN